MHNTHDHARNHPSASAHEAPRSKSERDSVSFKKKPVEFQTGRLGARAVSSPAASKYQLDNASANEAPSATRSKSERQLQEQACRVAHMHAGSKTGQLASSLNGIA